MVEEQVKLERWYILNNETDYNIYKDTTYHANEREAKNQLMKVNNLFRNNENEIKHKITKLNNKFQEIVTNTLNL